MASRTSIALCAPVLVAIFTLQGCNVPDAKGGGGGAEGCKSIENKDGGSLASAVSGDSGEVTCPNDGEYDGPALECGWVAKTCCAASQGDIDDKTRCWKDFGWVEKGHVLKEWPKGQKPTLLDPDDKLCPPKEKKEKKADKDTDDAKKDDATEGGLKDDSEDAGDVEEGGEESRRRLALPSVIEKESLTCKKKPKPASEEKNSKVGDKDKTDSDKLGDDADDKDKKDSEKLGDDDLIEEPTGDKDDDLIEEPKGDGGGGQDGDDGEMDDIGEKFSLTGQIASSRRATTSLSLLAIAAVALAVISVAGLRFYRTVLRVPLEAEPLAQDDPCTLTSDAEQGALLE